MFLSQQVMDPDWTLFDGWCCYLSPFTKWKTSNRVQWKVECSKINCWCSETELQSQESDLQNSKRRNTCTHTWRSLFQYFGRHTGEVFRAVKDVIKLCLQRPKLQRPLPRFCDIKNQRKALNIVWPVLGSNSLIASFIPRSFSNQLHALPAWSPLWLSLKSPKATELSVKDLHLTGDQLLVGSCGSNWEIQLFTSSNRSVFDP